MYAKKIIRIIAIASTLFTHMCVASKALSIDQQFQLFQHKYHKIYASSKIAAYRQRVFAENLAKIQKHNAENHDWRLGLNQYTDQTWDEFSKNRLLKAGIQFQLSNPPHNSKYFIFNNLTIPASVDWRTQGAVTPVKNQGQCGSSWAFATTGVMEGAGKIQLGTLRSLSEQTFLDCNTNNAACYGGQMNNALLFAEGGIPTEAQYPYIARAGSCRSPLPTPAFHISAYSQVAQNDEVALASAVAAQPIAIGIEADSSIFQFYQSGVVTSKNCGTTLNHALLIVGYGTEDGVPYWLCKNSWGSAWGASGYIKIARSLTSDGTPGICGIASYPWTITVDA